MMDREILADWNWMKTKLGGEDDAVDCLEPLEREAHNL